MGQLDTKILNQSSERKEKRMLVNLKHCKTTYYAGIRGTGYYVPDRIVTNKELEQYVNTTDEWIQQKIGIKERRVAADNEATSDLAYKASLMAIEDAGIEPQDIDLIILNCVCPDNRDPATACMVQAKLGAFNAAAFDVNAGSCPGTVYVLNIASNFITSGACKNVLVIGADVFTSIIDWQDRVTSCFFGDGAGAVILSRSAKPGLQGYTLYADGRGYEAIIVPQGGSKVRAENISINTGLRDGATCLDMDGKAVWDFATKVFPESIRQVADDAGIKVEDIDLVIPHQANVNIIKEGMKRLGLPFEKAFVNLDRYGNTASASVFIALAEAARQERLSPRSTVAMVAFGGGLAWASAIVQWNDRADFMD
ncbi:MAG: ketoacyl-ACP synthase III [Clostridia bacterium]|nr:ketoacyl-ACP synthase III [Clostridia bacterium]